MSLRARYSVLKGAIGHPRRGGEEGDAAAGQPLSTRNGLPLTNASTSWAASP
jgi:hypothetical protein